MAEVSIIVPVYNAKEHIGSMMESVFGQTHKDIEIILAENGSTDGSDKICEEYAAADSRVKVIRCVEKGVSIARNAGLEAATGEYVYFADADDLLSPELIEDNLALARQHNADIVVFGYIRLTEKRNGRLIRCKVMPKWEGILGSGDIKEHFGELALDNPHIWSRIFKREFIEKNGLRFKPLAVGEDDLYNISAFSAMPGTVCFNNRTYYCYVKRGNSAMSRYSSKSCESVFGLAREFERISGEMKLPEKSRTEAVNRYYIKAVSIVTGLMATESCPLTLKEKLDGVKRMMALPEVARAFNEVNLGVFDHRLLRIKLGLLKRGHYLSVILLGELLKSVKEYVI